MSLSFHIPPRGINPFPCLSSHSTLPAQNSVTHTQFRRSIMEATGSARFARGSTLLPKPSSQHSSGIVSSTFVSPSFSSRSLKSPPVSPLRSPIKASKEFSDFPRFSTHGSSSTKLFAGLSEIEPDLNEDFVDRWRTNGIDEEDFVYGKYDDHHTFFEGDQEKRSTWSLLVEEYESIGPPKGFQGLISWIFLPAVAAGMYFEVPGEYLYIGAAIFAAIFCVIEIDKPSEPHNFEPQIYNMERGARDKLINDYNTMDLWDFNEKYGDLWDFTIKKEASDIMKR